MGDATIVPREPKRGRASTKDDLQEVNRRHGLTCGVAVQGAAMCQAAQNRMDRLIETLNAIIVSEVHRAAAVGHHRLYYLTGVRLKIVRCSIDVTPVALRTISPVTLVQWSDLDMPADRVEVVRHGEFPDLHVLQTVIPPWLTAVPHLFVQQLLSVIQLANAMHETAFPSG